MKILHVITGLGIGGAERVLLDLSGEMVRQGHDVKIVSLFNDISAAARGVEPGVQIATLGITKSPTTWGPGVLGYLNELRRGSYAVVHAHMFHALVLAIIGKIFGVYSVPLVFTSHSSLVLGRARQFLLWSTRGLRSADVVFSRDQHVRLNSERCAVIPNGVLGRANPPGPRKAPESPGRWIFLNVARFSEPKNQLELVRQFAMLRVESSELWLVGDGPLREGVESAAKMLGVADRIRFLGERNDVMELLTKAHVFVLSSKWEGLPIVLLEAGITGVPVISTPVGSVPELLADDCGLVAEVTRLSDTMELTVLNYEAALGRADRLSARVKERYSIEAAAKSHVGLYTEIQAAMRSRAKP